MPSNRTVKTGGVWALAAPDVVPAPVEGTTYKDSALLVAEINAAWPFKNIVDSSKLNEMVFRLTTLMTDLESFGMLVWCATIPYDIRAFVIGSDGMMYRSLEAANLNNDPTTSPTKWEDVFAAEAISFDDSATSITAADVQAALVALDALAGTVVDGTITMAKLSSSATEADNVDRRVAKAWVNFNGQGVVAIRDDFNVSSITDVGAGLYTINFSANMADANYCPVLGCAFTDSGTNNLSANILDPLAMTVSALPIIVQTAAGANFDSEVVTCTVFGEQ